MKIEGFAKVQWSEVRFAFLVVKIGEFTAKFTD